MATALRAPAGNDFGRIQALGIGCVARRGGTGVVPSQTPLNKSASAKTLAEWDTKSPVMNLDLVHCRGRSGASMPLNDRREAAGASPGWLDMSEVIRKTCLEHQVRRRHSAPPPAYQLKKGFMYVMADLSQKASAVGRSNIDIGARSQWRRERSLSQDSGDRSHSPESAASAPAVGADSSGRRKCMATTPALVVPPSPLILPTSWDDLETEGHHSDGPCEVLDALEEKVVCKEASACPYDADRQRCRRRQDSLTTVPTTATGSCGGSSPTVASSLTHSRSGSSNPSPFIPHRDITFVDKIVLGGTNTAGFGPLSRLLGSRAAHIYEKRIKNMVLKEQKKALRRASAAI